MPVFKAGRLLSKTTHYDKATFVHADGERLDVYGCPSPNFVDFDGDGDLDLICGEFLDRFTYFENTGTGGIRLRS